MGNWLLKTEPGTYSWDDLVRDKRTTWDGVANAAALKNIRAMKKGDLAFVYHTGDVKAVVGVATIASDPYPDPNDKSGKATVVDLKPKSKLANPVTLATIKGDPAFEGFDLIRIGRLSVVSVPDTIRKRIETLAAGR
ncbi:MAG: EVE domain-containing protein [Planctomycetota bacterium]|nr:EVE domain-containing protein [Planctomycetota bacterium]